MVADFITAVLQLFSWPALTLDPSVSRGALQIDVLNPIIFRAEANAINRSSFLHQTPLFDAYYAPGAVKPLLAGGADLEARDDNGNTPLIRGAMVEAMVRELLADGADPAAVAKNGDTALKIAQKYNCVACAELITTSLKQLAGKAPGPATLGRRGTGMKCGWVERNSAWAELVREPDSLGSW